jgi:hypothetical protein
MILPDPDWELLHREVDGETTATESAELRERLSREPELKTAYEALVGVGRTLAEVALADPPPQLAADVMRQVQQRPAPAARWGGLSFLSGWVARQPALALASSLAVGLLAGLLVAGLSGRGVLLPLDGGSVSGTLLRSDHLAALPVIDEARLDGPGIQAVAATRRGRAVVVAELAIASADPVDITVEVDETALRPRGFECLGGEPGGVVFEPGRVLVRQAPSGQCFVSLAVLGADPGPVALRIQLGTGRAEATLRTGTVVE